MIKKIPNWRGPGHDGRRSAWITLYNGVVGAEKGSGLDAWVNDYDHGFLYGRVVEFCASVAERAVLLTLTLRVLS